MEVQRNLVNKLEKDIFLKRCMYKNYLIFGTTNLLSEKK
jgi:hypothetical protein